MGLIRCACQKAGWGGALRQRRWVVVGADTDDPAYNLHGVPREQMDAYTKRRDGRGHLPIHERVGWNDPTKSFDFTESQDRMFEQAETTGSSRGHADEMRRGQQRDLPRYRLREQRTSQQKRYLPGANTEIVTQPHPKHVAVLGAMGDYTKIERVTEPAKKSNKVSTINLYRAFWRLLRKFPPEAQPQLARTLRRSFKVTKKESKNRFIVTARLKTGRQILLRYIDFLGRRERLRTMHDPVDRFLMLHAEGEERAIDDLDFYPFTVNTNELKPIRDIGFHMVHKPARPLGSPGVPPPYAGLRRNIACVHKVAPARVLNGRGNSLLSTCQPMAVSRWLKHQYVNWYSPRRHMDPFQLMHT